MTGPGPILASLGLLVSLSALQAQEPAAGRLSAGGVLRATAIVDSVFVDRTLPARPIDGGDWAAYLLARLGAGPISDSLGIEIRVDSTHIEVSGRLQDLPAEARALLGPLANMVDSSTVVVADVVLQRTGPRVARFWLRGLVVNGYRFPEFLLGPMMAQVGRQYPALTASGRDLYVEVPADGVIWLGAGLVHLAVKAGDPPAPAPAPPPGRRR